MTIDIKTQMVTLLGTPLSQSFAARMQNRGYEAAGLNLLYFYTETDQEHLGDIIGGLRYMNFAGFAVTKPNKVEVLKYLDELDPLCRKMGSCNTVVRSPEGRLKGYNTDGTGFYLSITRDAGMVPEESTCFCIGTGGAGRAICSALAHHNVKKLILTDLFPESAAALQRDLQESFSPVDVETVPFGDYTRLPEADVIINASGVGMGSSIGKSPVPKELLPVGRLCFDACYNPAKTQFLMDAEAAGCRILNGLNMSLYQGAAQIELWTGKPAPLEAMRAELMEILGLDEEPPLEKGEQS